MTSGYSTASVCEYSIGLTPVGSSSAVGHVHDDLRPGSAKTYIWKSMISDHFALRKRRILVSLMFVILSSK